MSPQIPVIRSPEGPDAHPDPNGSRGGMRAAAIIDAAAITESTRTLVRCAGAAQVMAVVKADGYGHGAVTAARAALAGGASWLGTATLPEALALRAAGFTEPTLCWLMVPGEPLAEAVAADIQLSASAPWFVAEAIEAARAAGRPARLHLKVDSGLTRGGAIPGAGWTDLLDAAAKGVAGGELRVTGIWTHLVHADDPTHPTTDAQLDVFREAVGEAGRRGFRDVVRHAANSAATLTRPDSHFDLVRPGVASYGLTPVPEVASAAELGLHPAMTLVARVALVKEVPAGTGISYGHVHTTAAATRTALVPLGYADGIPRNGTNAIEVLIGGRRRRAAGRIAMDQFVVEVGPDGTDSTDSTDSTAEGDEVVLFGNGDRGEPTAQEWAEQLDTISYEVVTRIGARVPRVVVNEETA